MSIYGDQPPQPVYPPQPQPQPFYAQQVVYTYQQPVIPGRGKGIAGMTLGIVAWGLAVFTFGILSPVSAILSLIGLPLSIIGFQEANRAGAPKGMAIAGIVMNTIGVALLALFILLVAVGGMAGA